jgi:putative FmdB family regulatory protein
MPVYEYRCTKCGNEFEIMQKITDEPLTTCESCGGELRKLITNTSFVLKGTGWYVTDYPSPERKKAMESAKSEKKDTSTAGSQKDGTKKKAVNE